MYERTTICPYKKKCDSYHTIAHIEEQLHSQRRVIAIQNRGNIANYEELIEDIRQKLIRINKARERCQSRYKRCLRYWMLKREDEAKAKYTPYKSYQMTPLAEKASQE
jgi:hypothetical protein